MDETSDLFSVKDGKVSIRQDLILPPELREELRKPLGEMFECSDLSETLKGADYAIITVGDTVSTSLIESGLSPNMIIWDAKTERTPCNESSVSVLRGYAPTKRVNNPAGTISKEAWDLITTSLDKNRVSIFIEGEEDLLAIPAIVNSADRTRVIYGSPGKGAILIVVDRKIKALFLGLLSRFKK